ATFPTLFFELRNNTPYAKDNTTIIRVYHELLEAFKRRSNEGDIKPELLAIY
ncbi:MAG: hypothetical protein QG639_98, partial [Patescibacteria group bacterium]|nr:hypothetical protein [Patescibacteria group bacterium]